MPAKRYYGWKRQSPDTRDLRRVCTRRAWMLPQTVDLVPHMGPFLDQGQLRSCGPDSVAEEIGYDQNVEQLPALAPARLFIYYNTRQLMGDTATDSGVDNRTLLQALAEFGFCDEALWPYDVSQFAVRPSAAAYAAALPNAISKYLAIDVDLQAAQSTLADGYTFLLGGDVFQGIESDQASETGIVPVPAASETPIGGHDLTCCGYTLVDLPGVLPHNKWPAGTVRVRNHWTENGVPTGDGGYYYLPFEYAFNLNLMADFWTIAYAN